VSEAQNVYDFYKGSISLYLSISFFSLAPLWTGWSARLIWAGLGLAAIIICWMHQSRQALYFDNDSTQRRVITKKYKLPKKYQNLFIGTVLFISVSASTIGMFKFGFGEYQFIGFCLSIFMLAMAFSNLVYLRTMRTKYNLKK